MTDHLSQSRQTATETADAAVAPRIARARAEYLAGRDWKVPEADPETMAKVAELFERGRLSMTELLP